MTNETKHTPTPWKAVNGSIYANGSIDTYSGCVIGVIATAEDTTQCDSEGRIWSTEGGMNANAAHIVKCVNMHDELVKNIIELMDSYDSMCWNNFSCGAEGDEAYDNLTALLKKAGAL